jgi:ABC-type Fe3+-siderophore transport system permease subunit
LGDEEARTVAMNPERFQIILIAPASLVASSAVAVAVIIGLVGWSFLICCA